MKQELQDKITVRGFRVPKIEEFVISPEDLSIAAQSLSSAALVNLLYARALREECDKLFSQYKGVSDASLILDFKGKNLVIRLPNTLQDGPIYTEYSESLSPDAIEKFRCIGKLVDVYFNGEFSALFDESGESEK